MVIVWLLPQFEQGFNQHTISSSFLDTLQNILYPSHYKIPTVTTFTVFYNSLVLLQALICHFEFTVCLSSGLPTCDPSHPHTTHTDLFLEPADIHPSHIPSSALSCSQHCINAGGLAAIQKFIMGNLLYPFDLKCGL